MKSLKKVSRKVPVGINLGKNKDVPVDKAANDYISGLQESWSVADYFTINISSPNTENLRNLQAKSHLEPLLETIHIATLGTAITILIAFPIAFLAARNTTFNSLTWFIGRLILVTSRSVNTVVWGLLFVAIFGPRPIAGIWAIAFRSIGFMGKLIAEAIEEIDQGVVEAIEATGASKLQVLVYAILPQVLPVIYGTTVYRWDINIRESTVLGFVGAGGIGILLYSSINQFLWQEVALMLLAVFGVVVISEFVSAAVRQKIS